MSISRLTNGMISDPVYLPVPSGEIEIELSGPAEMEVALNAARLEVELNG